MSKVCAITGKGPLSGNKRSHSMRASRRNWNVNLQKVKVVVDGKPQTCLLYTSCSHTPYPSSITSQFTSLPCVNRESVV